ncbi:biopolymer transporter ExbD [Pendulispora albinea]|uniref:Biopolymer transporter ExbD n=1 Tax=Pendulispora albinea TaxID=2741071 RepID=A0ABZ2LPZ6_9BACT
MAGVDIGGGGGGRRSLDSEINMIPMIDLLMVTISFLLITAVWSHMARLNADAQVPGPPRPDEEITKVEPEKQLHIEMRDQDKSKFTLVWKQGATVVNSIDVPRKDVVVNESNIEVIRYPELARKITEEWKNVGSHRDATDRKLDQAVLHTDNDTPYSNIIGVIDAVYQTHRPMNLGSRTEPVSAFNVTFSVN